MQYHKYSLTEIENMMPWERDIYVGLLQAHLEEERLKEQQRKASNGWNISSLSKLSKQNEV